MSQLDALDLANAIRTRLTDYASDLHYVRSREFAEKLRHLWSDETSMGKLVSDIWLEGTFPSEPSTYNLQKIVEEGIFDQTLAHFSISFHQLFLNDFLIKLDYND